MYRLLLALALVAGLGSGLAAAERTVTLAVDNMTCVSCPFIVKNALADVDGVRQVDVSFEAKTASVVFDDAVTTADALIAATTDAGYPARLAP